MTLYASREYLPLPVVAVAYSERVDHKSAVIEQQQHVHDEGRNEGADS